MSDEKEIKFDLVRATQDSLLRRVYTENAYAVADLVGLDLSETQKVMNLDSIPSRWRLKAWQNLYSRQFKKTLRMMCSDNSDLSDGSLKGIIESMKRHLNDLEPESEDERANIEGIKQAVGFMDTAIHKEFDLSKRSSESARNFLKAEISSNIPIDEEHLTGQSDAEIVYLSLLRNADHIEQMDTVDEMYESIKELMGHRIPHSIESFRKICTRIGLVGRKTIEKRKSMDS